jgi:SpoVK/Ycf46/Vps4 family AAA+-type ATPase
MPLNDCDFSDLVAAYRGNPQSQFLRRSLIQAADTPERREMLVALLDTYSTAHINPDLDIVPSLSGSDEARTPDTSDTSNVVELSTGATVPQKASVPMRLADVGGLDEVKAQLRRRMLDPLQHPSLFERFKRRTGGGLLLYGPPGCGKTMVVKAVAAEAQLRLIKVEAAEVLDCAVGVSEKRIAAAFAEARAAKPSILFFDEVEALASRRSQGSDFKASLVSAFLNAFDGMSASNDKVLVMGATNAPWAIDSAFRRPGRFDRSIFVPPPDRQARSSILLRSLETRPIEQDIDCDHIASVTSGFSGADLANLVETAIDLAIEESLRLGQDQKLAKRHFERAQLEVRPTTLEWLTTARNYAKYANEAGTYNDVLAFLDKYAA